MSAESASARRSLGKLHRFVAAAAFLILTPLVALVATAGTAEAAPCTPPVVNKVVCENTLPGDENWQVIGTDDTIAGFTTDASATPGSAVTFKIKTNAASYRMDIYRLGWYGGTGARRVATLNRTTPQVQPNCLRDTATALTDCGNWATSLSWQVPSDAVSGIYYARLHRDDTGAENEIAFVVRDDTSHSSILLQTSEATTQAYNQYGGASFYVGDGPGKDGSAFKVSYNRPLEGYQAENFIFNAEYPMLKFLEHNGYDVSYTTDVDTARRGNLITNHKVFMAVGHDEYWSNEQRTNVEAARNAGVHMAFLTANDIFWKTRWEKSTDGSATDWRTLVCYKETKAPQVDPSPQWTGTWRDPRVSPPKDGGRPENALLGNIFTVNGRRDDSLEVPAEYGKMRLWRNTPLATMAAGSTYTFRPGTLGYEWNSVEDNGFQPAGVAQLSRTTVNLDGPYVLQNYGDVYGSGTKTHALTMYRHPSGSIIFAAGTVQWAWGVDDEHAYETNTPTTDVRIQQATINFLADMGVQPSTLQSGLVAASGSTDTTPPTVAITSTAAPQVGTPYTMTGTVSDTGGRVAGVEVSTDGGNSWHPATWLAGQTSWTYTYIPNVSGPMPLRARAVDDSVNLSTPVTQSTTVAAPQCPCGIWPDTAVPTVPDTDEAGSLELGVKWRSTSSGYVRGVQFYKGAGNTGPHTGSLWSASGELLATGSFTNEAATGWQSMTFPTPVAVQANTTYVVSYHTTTGHYASDLDYFTTQQASQEPLTALRSGVDGPNGVFRGGAGFPNQSFQGTNYWVDVLWATDPGPDTRAPVLSSTSPVDKAGTVALDAHPAAVYDEVLDPATVQFTVTSGATAVGGTAAVGADGKTVAFTPSAALAGGTTFTATVNVKDVAGNAAAPVTWTFTTGGVRPATCPCTVWDDFAVPALPDAGDPSTVELGTKVRFDGKGEVLGVRFYKGPGNIGTHTGSLWTASGQRLATGTFANESASGWQTLLFSAPVAVQANTTYVVSYLAPSGHYSATGGYFAGASANYAALHALQAGTDGPNGVYRYGAGGGFPTATFNSTNYWVDAIYRGGLNGDTIAPALQQRTPAPGATGVSLNATLTATFNERVDPASAQVVLTDPGGARLAGTPSVSADGLTLTWTPPAVLAPQTAYGVSLRVADENGVPMTDPATWSFTTGTATCPCSLFSAATVPTAETVDDPGDYEFGVRLTPSLSGKITGVRFYKGVNNTGTHTGSLWSATGERLATGTFGNETASGWQTLTFATPVTVLSGQTYVASYTTSGLYSADGGYFQRTSVSSPPLASAAGANGVYHSGGPGFPTSSYQGGNYWVDAIFTPTSDTTVPTVTARTPTASATNVPLGGPATATFSEPVMTAGSEFTVSDKGGAKLNGTMTLSPDGTTISWSPAAPFAAGTTYTASVRAVDLEGNAMTAPDTWSFTTTATQTCPCSMFSAATAPTVVNSGDDGDYEMGVRFTPASSGTITGVKFYKGPNNTGTHTGSLWNAAGQRLATGTFTNESATGWQTLTFATPVTVIGGQTYTASYTTLGFYSTNPDYFSAGAVTSPPLATTTGVNGVFAVGTGFPTSTFQNANYWVDVVFTASADTVAPTVTARSPAPSATDGAVAGPVTATFSEPMMESGAQFTVKGPGGVSLTGNVALSADQRTLSFTPSAPFANGTTYAVSVQAMDTAGNAMAASDTWSFTATATAACPCSLFSAATVPTNVSVDDPGDLELGIRFTPAQNGVVTGVRFYKGPNNAGTHTGSLWDSAGQQLATGTFTNETATGWQTLTFATPVPVVAGQTYTASYTTSGFYSADPGFFQNNTVNSPPLAAASGANGVFRAGGPGFPTSTFQGGNYWVDVVFAQP